MFTRPFHPDHFLRSVYGTEPFVDYCRHHHIVFEQAPATRLQTADVRRWVAALAQLSREQHAQVELEMATVNEMAHPEAVAHLLEVAEGKELPPDHVPGGAPLALWFLLHHPDLFHEVFLHHEIREVDSWRTAKAPAHLRLLDLDPRARALAATLRKFFQAHEGTGRFCAVEGYQLPEAACFVAHVADRLQFFQTFTDAGRPTRQRLRPARQVLFVYYPRDGTVLFQSHLRSRERTAGLLECFGQAVLGAQVIPCQDAFHLDLLKQPFHPLRDAADMEMVRVKALHLRSPERHGRRLIKLETLASDTPSAIDHLLLSVGGRAGLVHLQVCHAELQVRLRLGGRSKNFSIRLWPNRCNLSLTALGNRFRACLKRWGLLHAP